MFDPATIEKLAYYVYFLEDPRDGEIFYIGKGIGNRVFYHINSAISSKDSGDKLDRIRDIIRAGHEVEHFILRHGLSESAAFELEAAFIDLLGMENLSNIMGGHYSNDFGLKSVKGIQAMYEGNPLVTDEPVLLVNINSQFRRDMTTADIYETTRKSWIVGERRNKVRFAISVYQGLSREVYEVRKWFPIYVNGKLRWGFKGRLAKNSIRDELIYKSIRRHYKRGATNPLKYLNC
jgi:hypothetical protein